MRCSQSLLAGCFVLIFCGCSTLETTPQKFSLSKAGYASVERAPAAAPIAQLAASSGIGAEMWRFRAQQEYAQEAQTLQAKLRAEEGGNFSELRIEWEPEFHYLVSFRQDAAATLAKHTSNPIFKPNTVKYTTAQLQSKSDELSSILLPLSESPIELSSGSEIDILQGKVIVWLDIYEQDFEIYPSLKALKNDPMVQLNYNAPLDPPDVLSAEVKPLIRHFSHGVIREPHVVLWSYEGKIILKEGCFFLDHKGRKDQLLVFAKRVGVTLDDAGYIALIDRSSHPGNKTTTRVGEPARWYSGPKAVTDPEILIPLQAACGAHDAVIIGAPSPHAG